MRDGDDLRFWIAAIPIAISDDIDASADHLQDVAVVWIID